MIRKDLCSEAIRLTLLLTENPLTNSTKASALLALMCFQSSRLDARADDAGEVILYEDQDKSRWSRELIDKGNHYLVNACSGNEISKYHLEAGIAYWHTTPTDKDKWQHILQLYNELIQIEYSPMTALNRTFAFAKVYGNQAGLKEALKLELKDNSNYHALLGYLLADNDKEKAILHYKEAVRLTGSRSERLTLAKEIKKLIRSR